MTIRNPSKSASRVPPWLIAIGLTVIAICLVLRDSTSARAPMFSSAAMAQTAGTSGASGVFAFTGQLDKNSHGLFMVDVDAGTLWCYEIAPGQHTLKLVAARNWRFDRYLERYHTDPPPEVIESLLEEQRQAKLMQGQP